ncbi:extracellular solute-binding protein [Paenibacillus eucommiae]|uniref:ABC-type glycerol-3-phosphate transport system substrate-binding protein n=1 Tax=Paenibacillus eucommiae TaxID=1355755 RepID=A0ABS4IVB1_9BACL|nr:extracellular solute-binding protein [Paenibacillus eucommiae]MBP1990931.1 ABC-type glycerol-3-phosphate transport system substrate-binding protein [Paenibacillus eucommiae]
MRKKAKFTVVILLLLSMLVYISACSSTKEKGNNVTGSPSSSESASSTPAKEPVTLTFWSASMANNVPSGIQEDPIAKQIEKELNIKIDMETHPSKEKLAARLASGDMMDIMVISGLGELPDQASSFALDMEPLLEKFGPDIKKNIPAETLAYNKNILGRGQLKYISTKVSEVSALPDSIYGGVYLRWDYYKELGYPEIKTYDDYLNVVAEMLKKHPTNEDGKKYYGFSPWFEWGPRIITDTMTVRHEGYETAGATQVLEIERNTFATRNAFLDENSSFWNGVEFWNKANQKGLLDPDSFTQKYDQALQKYSTNQVLASEISWMIDGANTYLRGKGIYDKGFFGPIPITGSKSYYYNNFKYGNSNVFMINKNSKHPEEAMKLINWLYSVHGAMTVLNGIEGTDWTNIDGKYAYTATHDTNILDPDHINKYGYGKFENNLGLLNSGVIPGTKDPLNIALSRDLLIESLKLPENKLMKEVVDYYKVEVPYDVLPAGVTYGTNPLSDLTPFLPSADPDEIVRLNAKIDNYQKQEVPKLILAKNDAEFKAEKAKAIEEFKKLGVEKVYEYTVDNYTKAIAALKANKN